MIKWTRGQGASMRSDGFLRNFCIWAAVGTVCMTARQVLRDVPVGGAIMVGVGAGVAFGLIMAVSAALAPEWNHPDMDWDAMRAALIDPNAPRPVVDVREHLTLAMAPDRALALCRATLRADGHFAGVRVNKAAGTVRGRGRLSWESVGERMECRVRPVEGGSQVEIRSRPLLRTTLQDWGKNRENVDRIRDALQSHERPSTLAAPHRPEAEAPVSAPGAAGTGASSPAGYQFVR
jgi:hypothetical protein